MNQCKSEQQAKLTILNHRLYPMIRDSKLDVTRIVNSQLFIQLMETVQSTFIMDAPMNQGTKCKFIKIDNAIASPNKPVFTLQQWAKLQPATAANPQCQQCISCPQWLSSTWVTITVVITAATINNACLLSSANATEITSTQWPTWRPIVGVVKLAVVPIPIRIHTLYKIEYSTWNILNRWIENWNFLN